MSYLAPDYNKNNFTCPYCGVLAEQKWSNTSYGRYTKSEMYSFNSPASISGKDKKIIAISTCNYCHNEHVWIEEKMIIPKVSNVPISTEDMPEKVKKIYNEARDVFSVSPKAAAALLRLALQHLCVELGEKGKNINDDIGELVKKGLPVEIQQALDIVRVVGNNAVHPGELDLEDNSTNTGYLFNIIVDNRIVQPKKINDFYSSLPQGTLDRINIRDKQKELT